MNALTGIAGAACRAGSIIAAAALTITFTTPARADLTKPIKQPATSVVTTKVQPRFTPGPAFAAALRSNATGIYNLGTSSFGSAGSAATYALVHGGQIKQVHSKMRGSWMPKQAGSSGGVSVSGPTFDQLMTLAGGADRNVNTLPAATRDRFLCLAALKTGCAGSAPGSGTQLPAEVTPSGGACPAGYRFQLKTDANGGKLGVCRIIARRIDSGSGWLAAADTVLDWLVPLAQARDCGPIGCLEYFSFGEIETLRFAFEYNPQGGYWGFNGFGIIAIFILPEPGP